MLYQVSSPYLPDSQCAIEATSPGHAAALFVPTVYEPSCILREVDVVIPAQDGLPAYLHHMVVCYDYGVVDRLHLPCRQEADQAGGIDRCMIGQAATCPVLAESRELKGLAR